jgi:thiamine pyrophosphate-dependent acetolactate synthase large subunit-like protein
LIYIIGNEDTVVVGRCGTEATGLWKKKKEKKERKQRKQRKEEKKKRRKEEKKKRRKDKKGEQYIISPLSRVEDGVTPSTFLLPVDNLGCVEISQQSVRPRFSCSIT